MNCGGLATSTFIVCSSEYGFVEVAHLALCHAVLDIDMALGTAGLTEDRQNRAEGTMGRAIQARPGHRGGRIRWFKSRT